MKLRYSDSSSHLKLTSTDKQFNIFYPLKNFSSIKNINPELKDLDNSDINFYYGKYCKIKSDSTKRKPNWIKIGSLTIFTVGAGAFLHNFQQHAWWSGQREKFHVEWDWAYALTMDKLGHFFVGGIISNSMRRAFEWSGMDYKPAIWLGSIFSIGYMTDIEIEDGHAKEWGYSPGDEIFNLGGDIFSILRDLYKPVNNFKIKWSYLPTGDPQHKGDFPDDYNGQTFWLSCDIYNFLPEKIKRFWPEWLNFAIGYGVKKYDDPGPNNRIQNFYLSPDINLFKIISGNTGLLLWLKDLIDNFKLIPMPALKWNYTNHNFQFVFHF